MCRCGRCSVCTKFWPICPTSFKPHMFVEYLPDVQCAVCIAYMQMQVAGNAGGVAADQRADLFDVQSQLSETANEDLRQLSTSVEMCPTSSQALVSSLSAKIVEMRFRVRNSKAIPPMSTTCSSLSGSNAVSRACEQCVQGAYRNACKIGLRETPKAPTRRAVSHLQSGVLTQRREVSGRNC